MPKARSNPIRSKTYTMDVRHGSILLKNSFALPGRTPHRKIDRSECAASDASEAGKGSTTPRIHSESRAEEFFNGIGQKRSFAAHRLRARPRGVQKRIIRACCRYDRGPEETHETRQTSSTPELVARTQAAAHIPNVRQAASYVCSEDNLEKPWLP